MNRIQYTNSNEFDSENEAVSSKNAMATLHAMDAISNILCKVIDTAELCRQSHYDPQWRAMAEQVFGALSEYIHDLNTDVELYQVVNGILKADEAIIKKLEIDEREGKPNQPNNEGSMKNHKSAL